MALCLRITPVQQRPRTRKEFMSEKTENENVLTDEVKILVAKVVRSFIAAASMILGQNEELYDKYFSFMIARIENVPHIVIVEDATGTGAGIPIPFEVAKINSDREYFEVMKELARKALPHIPEEMIVIPKDEWPDPPVWETSDQENQID